MSVKRGYPASHLQCPVELNLLITLGARIGSMPPHSFTAKVEADGKETGVLKY
jgi:hypothetical protein